MIPSEPLKVGDRVNMPFFSQRGVIVDVCLDDDEEEPYSVKLDSGETLAFDAEELEKLP